MKAVKALFIAIIIISLAGLSGGTRMLLAKKTGDRVYGIVIHGGAGNIQDKTMSAEKKAEYRKKLDEALTAGYRILEKGGTGMDAVEAAIRIMEDSPLFNSGKGAVFTSEGTNELDASVMDGKTLNAGAVAGVKRVKNPISLARKVMEKSPHVMLTGAGAEAFAQELGITLVSNTYFRTEARWDSYLRVKERKEKEKSPKPGDQKNAKESASNQIEPKDFLKDKFGTVGAVALDKHGNLAAGTSTGGMTFKKYGRVGDSPVIGAGTYADNRTCAVSCTGWGEYFIRLAVAFDISAMMMYKNLPVIKAGHDVLEKVKALGGHGGVIAIDKNGNVAMPFNTKGMFRGFRLSSGKTEIALFGSN
jgi:L-asparaginase / beta-aspartyl-peptidase